MSWSRDILEILEKWEYTDKEDDRDVIRLLNLLKWFRYMLTPSEEIKASSDLLVLNLVNATADCLLEELNRLGEGTKGSWGKREKNRGFPVLYYSSIPSLNLHIELLPNFSITLQSRKKSSRAPKYEKILVPYGANASQVFNLLDIVARDIYYKHFDHPELYLNHKRRLTQSKSEKKEEHRHLFSFFSKHRFQLQVLFLLSKRIWTHEIEKMKEEYEEFETEV